LLAVLAQAGHALAQPARLHGIHQGGQDLRARGPNRRPAPGLLGRHADAAIQADDLAIEILVAEDVLDHTKGHISVVMDVAVESRVKNLLSPNY